MTFTEYNIFEFTEELGKLQIPTNLFNKNENTINQIIDFENKWKVQLINTQIYFDRLLNNYKNKLVELKDTFKVEISDYKNNIKNELQELIYTFHNPKLINIHLSPVDNVIYKLHNDFSITCEKGGWAYNQRGRLLCMPPLGSEINHTFRFPTDNKYSIMELSNCMITRQKYEMYLTL